MGNCERCKRPVERFVRCVDCRKRDNRRKLRIYHAKHAPAQFARIAARLARIAARNRAELDNTPAPIRSAAWSD